MSAGIGKVFWAATESAHLVDVVNQTDAVESVDGEQKLGQPMLYFSAIKAWGTLDTLILPYFRERTFAGVDGRLRSPLPLSESVQYQSRKKQKHIDYAVRYSAMLGDWDHGLRYFHGTNCDPYYQVVSIDGQLALVPFYAQSEQLGLDLQSIIGDWLWKLEAIYRDSFDNHAGVVAGYEYTLIGVFDLVWDIGLITEYLYDSRGNNAQIIGQNDLFVGSRFVVNDEAGTEVLIGITQDLVHSDVFTAKLEASSRLNNYLRWRIDGWLFENNTPTDRLYFGRKDDLSSCHWKFISSVYDAIQHMSAKLSKREQIKLPFLNILYEMLWLNVYYVRAK